MSTKNQMFNRTIRSINKEIHECLENINTWSSTTQRLIEVKRRLLRCDSADVKFYMLLKALEDAYYNDNLSEDRIYDCASIQKHRINKVKNNRLQKKKSVRRSREESGEESNERSDEDEQNTKENSNDGQSEDIDDYLKQHVYDGTKQENNKSCNNNRQNKKLSSEQQAALHLLDQHEKEQQDLDEYVAARRKQMNADMKNPPKSNVRFTLSDSKAETVEEETADEETVEEETADEETVDEETVDEETVDEETVDEETVDEETVDEETVDEETKLSDTKETDNSNPVTVEHIEKIMASNNTDDIDSELIAMLESKANKNKDVINTTDTVNVTPVIKTQTDQVDTTDTVNVTPVIKTPTDQVNTVVPVVFQTSDLEPAPINALTKMSANKRNILLQQIYVDAKAKILKKNPNEKNQDVINQKIKNECDSALKHYIENH